MTDTTNSIPGSDLRLLVLTELFLPTKGGTAVWFDAVYRRLGGKAIHVITAETPGAEDHDSIHPNSIHRVRLTRHWWLKPESLAIYARMAARALAISSKYRFEGIHAGRVLPEGLVGLLVAKLRSVPLLTYAHGEEITTWRQPGKLRAMTYTYRHSDRIIANSAFTSQELIKLGVHAERITIIYPGVDLQRFRPDLPTQDVRLRLHCGQDTKVIVSVGRLSPRKGFDQVIQALSLLRIEGMDVVYAVIGVGEDGPRLEQLARDAGVQAHVHFLGDVPPADLPSWYNAGDVFAMPNRVVDGDTEGFGMVFIEASACGKPVIAGREGGTGDAVIDGVTGLRVDGTSKEAITDALRELLIDSMRAAELGANGLKRAQTEFSWQRVAEKTARLTSEMSQAV